MGHHTESGSTVPLCNFMLVQLVRLTWLVLEL